MDQAVRARYESVGQRQAQERQQQLQAASTATAAADEEEDDDYEPEYQPMDVLPASQEPELSLGPFVLPQPPPLTQEEARTAGESAVDRIFAALTATEPSSSHGSVAAAAAAAASKKGDEHQKLGFSRVAGSSGDRETWVLLLCRLASRASADLTDEQKSIADSIRSMFYRYIVADFRSRLISIGTTWLNEEWYNDRVQLQFLASLQRGKEEDNDAEAEDALEIPLHYDRWVIRVLDGILPYVDARDVKVLIRFLSEIPDFTIPVAQRVAGLARDPERVNLCVQALLYVLTTDSLAEKEFHNITELTILNSADT